MDELGGEQAGIFVPTLPELDNERLQYWLTFLILEVHTKNGSEYTPNTLHNVVSGISTFSKTPLLLTSAILLIQR